MTTVAEPLSHGSTPPQTTTGVQSPKLALWIFLASEVIFFSGLIGGSLLLRLQSKRWPHPGEVLNIPLTTLNTFLLIVSSVTVVMGLSALQEGRMKAFKGFLIATALLGMTFLGIQAFEYRELYMHGLRFDTYQIRNVENAVPPTPGEAAPGHPVAPGEPVAPGVPEAGAEGGEHSLIDSPFGTTFYIQTGFHGTHVFCGVVWLWVIIWKAFQGHFDKKRFTSVEIFGLYWHFVDLVWILLFTIVYLV